MAYQAREGDCSQVDARNIKNNTKAVNAASEVAIASGNPYAMAAGAAVKAADKVTQGKSSEALGKALNQVTKNTPGGDKLQEGLNRLGESGTTDKVGQAASMYNGMSGNGTGTTARKEASTAQTGTDGNTSKSSDGFGGLGGFGGKKKPSSFFDDPNQNGADNNDTDFEAYGEGQIDVKKVTIFVAPVLILLILFMTVITAVNGGITEFDDAFGANYSSGGDTGDIEYEPSSQEAADFYDRINTVKLVYQASGKTIDVLKIAAVYHIMNINNNEYDYDYMTTPRIQEIASAMFVGNSYSESAFKENLANDIFATYFADYSQAEREQLAEDVFDYIERYYNFIGSSTSSACSAAGTCTYDIKGFWLPSAGNVSKPMQITNLMVRLMECGSPYGNGSYTTPIDQDLVPFEDYVAGVANAEIGSYAPIEAIKAQMVAARSFALARPTGMGNSAGKKLEEENGQWILQISSCVADQVFCNINEGCSFMGGGDGQGGICRSGIVAGAVRTRDALALDNQLRTAAAATEGEVLVNSDGYIIQTGYLSTEQNLFTKYANSGMNYKQILLEVYNSDARPYGAADIQKMSCASSNSSSCGSASTGPYASWKQYEGPWISVQVGTSGKTIKQIGCLVTSVTMLIAKSGVPTVLDELNPGTFVEYLNAHNGFSGGNFVWESVSNVAPTFKYKSKTAVFGYTKQQKLNKLTELMNNGCYVVAEVKGNTGQHWVAIDAISGSTVTMMDPGSASTDLWAQYNWKNTSKFVCFKVES